MKKRIFIAAILAVLLSTPTVFAQSQLAQKYRAGMLPMFLRYVAQESMSDNYAEWMTPGQEKMAELLYEEAKEFGFPTHFSADKYIYVNIPSNLKKRQVPKLGISAHYDTTPDTNNKGVQPQVIEKYDGQPIVLKNGHVIDFNSDPYLQKMIGKTIVTSDGTTNLGADDKAGITIVMTLLKTLAENPNIPHGPIDIVLTPNEETGRCAERLELAYYNPDYAFDFDATVDGEVISGNFSADKIVVSAPNQKEAYRITFIAQGINGHQSYAATNGYKNSPKPISDLIARANDSIQQFSSCKIITTEEPETVYDANKNTHTHSFLIYCEQKAQAEQYIQSLQKVTKQIAANAEITIDMQSVKLRKPLDTQDNYALAIAKVVTHAVKTDDLPDHSGINGNEKTEEERQKNYNKGYLEPHHMDSYMVDFRLRYFDQIEGRNYQDRVKHVADSVSKTLNLAEPLEVAITKQYENVEYGVRPEMRKITAAAIKAAGITPDFKKERAGTTPAVNMAALGFGGYSIFTGQVNPHAFTEWLSEEDMFKAYEVALNLIKEVSQQKIKSNENTCCHRK